MLNKALRVLLLWLVIGLAVQLAFSFQPWLALVYGIALAGGLASAATQHNRWGASLLSGILSLVGWWLLVGLATLIGGSGDENTWYWLVYIAIVLSPMPFMAGPVTGWLFADFRRAFDSSPHLVS